MSRDSVLTVEDVSKRFGAVTAVDGVSLDLRDGEILALLGPNGAGKTTLLRMIVGIFRPDAGRVTHYLGGAPGPEPPRRVLGYLPEERGLYQDMPVLRTLVYFGALHGMDRGAAARAAGPWLERLSLDDRAGEPVKALSKGNQQKVQFVAAVLHRPRLAVLDEPFSGLDPVNQDLFVELIRELRDAGTTVLVSAHQMALVEKLADRIYLLGRGRVVLHGTIPDLRSRWRAGDRLVLTLSGDGDASFLATHPAVEQLERSHDPREVGIRLRPGIPIGDVLRLVGERLEVESIRSEHVSLHEIYVRTVAEPDAAVVGS